MCKSKHLIFLLLVAFNLSIVAQDQKEIVLKTEASEATVFINGAQVLRNKSVNLQPGKTKIRITNLSPYIDAKSVQVKMSGDVMVTSVNHQMNYLDSVKIASKQTDIDKRLEELSNKIESERTNKEVIKEELTFLTENRKIGGSNNGVSLTSLRETANYYRERMSSLKAQDAEAIKRIAKLQEQIDAINKERNQEGQTKPTPIGEVIVEVECNKITRADMELTYYVRNAGWYPTYDIRATTVEEPIELIYKANIRQNTQEEWKNVKLKVSSANPSLGNVAPQLQPYMLNYYTKPPRYDVQNQMNQVSGTVREEGINEPIIGAIVNFTGTTVGTATDTDGRFSLSIPQGATSLTFSYLGFENKVMSVSNSHMNVYLRPSNQLLEEVVVVGYGSVSRREMTGSVAGISSSKSKSKREDMPMPTVKIENQTAVEFEVKIPYTIKSDNKNTVVEVDRYELPAEYEYYAIPKANKDVFLLANIVDWEKYNLLEGEANIFFENTYVGKTVLDVRYTSDTLNISLGRDKNVSVSREKVKEYNTKKFFGSKKEDTRVWKITVKNNKKQTIDLLVLDQVPVSTNQEIEVETENVSNGVLNKETGEVKWKFRLNPADKKEVELKYKVKYPKSKNLTIE